MQELHQYVIGFERRNEGGLSTVKFYLVPRYLVYTIDMRTFNNLGEGIFRLVGCSGV